MGETRNFVNIDMSFVGVRRPQVGGKEKFVFAEPIGNLIQRPKNNHIRIEKQNPFSADIK